MHRACSAVPIAMTLFAAVPAVAAEFETAQPSEAVVAALPPSVHAFTVERHLGPSQPIDVTDAPAVDPYGRPLYELGGIGYRWWVRHGRAELGLGIGTVGYLVAPIDAPAGTPQALLHGASTVTIGWRWSVGERSLLYADASGMRRYGADLVQAKVGVEWKARTSRLGFERGALGVRFDSGYRMSLRAKRGGLGVYLRSQF